MACYISESGGSFKTTRTAHLSDEIEVPISAAVERDYGIQVAARLRSQEDVFTRLSMAHEAENARLDQLGLRARLKSQEEEFARLSIAQETEKARLHQLGLSLTTRAEEVGNRERGLTSREETLITAANELDQQRTRQEQRDKELGKKGTNLLANEIELVGLASDLDGQKRRQQQHARELSEKDTELFTKEIAIAGQSFELQQEKHRQEKRDRELRDKDATLMFKEFDVAFQAGEVKKEVSKLQKTARGLDRKANRLSAKERELEERKRREEAERRQRHHEAEAEIAAQEAGLEAAHCEVVARWRETEYQQAREGVHRAKELLRAGELSKARFVAERASADLERVEKQAFDDERRQERRKLSGGILVTALHRLGYLRVGMKSRDKTDPRSDVDVAGVMPSGKAIVFTLRHDGTTEIRQRGVEGHQECHKVEDAIAAITRGMGLAFRGGHKTATKRKRPTDRAPHQGNHQGRKRGVWLMPPVLLDETEGPPFCREIARQFNLGRALQILVPDGMVFYNARGLFHCRLMCVLEALAIFLRKRFELVLAVGAGEINFANRHSQKIAEEILQQAPAIDRDDEFSQMLGKIVGGQEGDVFDAPDPREKAALGTVVLREADCSRALIVPDAENLFPAHETDKLLLDNPRVWRDLTNTSDDVMVVYITRNQSLLHPHVTADVGPAVVVAAPPTEEDYTEFLKTLRILHSRAFDGHPLNKIAEAARSHSVGYRSLWSIVRKCEAGKSRLSPKSFRHFTCHTRAEDSLVLREKPDVTFDDVAGLEEVKSEIDRRIVFPVTHPGVARRYGKTIGGSVLLFGPPGTGKTLVARAVAGVVKAVFYVVRASDIMSKWVGDAEKNMRALFDQAAKQELAVIFFDEIEALVSRRGKDSAVMDRLIPEFLSLVDGVEGRRGSVLLLGACNRPWDMDEAALRPGRFNELIYVGPPDATARAAILAKELEGVPVKGGLDLHSLAARLEGFSGADIVGLVQRITDRPYERDIGTGKHQRVTPEDVENALACSKPSITKKMLARYERFAKERS